MKKPPTTFTEAFNSMMDHTQELSRQELVISFMGSMRASVELGRHLGMSAEQVAGVAADAEEQLIDGLNTERRVVEELFGIIEDAKQE